MEQRDRLTVSDFLTWLDGRVSRMETGTNIHGELIERFSDLLAPLVRAAGCRKYSGSLGVFCANGDVRRA